MSSIVLKTPLILCGFLLGAQATTPCDDAPETFVATASLDDVYNFVESELKGHPELYDRKLTYAQFLIDEVRSLLDGGAGDAGNHAGGDQDPDNQAAGDGADDNAQGDTPQDDPPAPPPAPAPQPDADVYSPPPQAMNLWSLWQKFDHAEHELLNPPADRTDQEQSGSISFMLKQFFGVDAAHLEPDWVAYGYTDEPSWWRKCSYETTGWFGLSKTTHHIDDCYLDREGETMADPEETISEADRVRYTKNFRRSVLTLKFIESIRKEDFLPDHKQERKRFKTLIASTGDGYQNELLNRFKKQMENFVCPDCDNLSEWRRRTPDNLLLRLGGNAN